MLITMYCILQCSGTCLDLVIAHFEGNFRNLFPAREIKKIKLN